jgi:ABC-type Fe3+-hydroxamate transport system substrate-binding protein
MYTSRLVSLVITAFSCTTKKSHLIIQNGLSSKVWLDQLNNVLFCNLSVPHDVVLGQHKYITLLLALELQDVGVTFSMTFNVTTKQGKLGGLILKMK